MRRVFSLTLAVSTAATLAFLALPLAAIFARVPLGRLLGQLGDRVVLDALVVTAKTNGIGLVLIVLVGTPTAYLLGSQRFPGRSLVVTLVELPLVLPPAVAGIGLLAAFGRSGLLGGSLHALGVSLPFTQAAVVLAIVFVASPFYIRPAIASFETLDPNLLDAARTLGAGPARIFGRVALPLALQGLAAGAALALARGIGEFGATLMFAGSFQSVTQTVPLAIYAEFERNLETALALGALLVAISAAILILLKVRLPWTRSVSTWPSLFARSS